MEWGAGRYEVIARQLLPAAEVVVAQAAPSEGDRVLDLGCGNGNAALLAAERGARVVGVDPAQRLLDVAAADAAERGLDAEFLLGDAADIPVEDASADLVISVFGVIFAPDAASAAAEVARVTASEGRIVFSAWIPEGTMFRAVRLMRQTVMEVRGDPPPPPPFAWHDPDALSGLFGAHGFSVSVAEHGLPFTSDSADEFVRTEGESHPLAVAARPALEAAGRADELQEGMREIYEEGNEDQDGFRVTSRYVVADLRRG